MFSFKPLLPLQSYCCPFLGQKLSLPFPPKLHLSQQAKPILVLAAKSKKTPFKIPSKHFPSSLKKLQEARWIEQNHGSNNSKFATLLDELSREADIMVQYPRDSDALHSYITDQSNYGRRNWALRAVILYNPTNLVFSSPSPSLFLVKPPSHLFSSSPRAKTSKHVQDLEWGRENEEMKSEKIEAALASLCTETTISVNTKSEIDAVYNAITGGWKIRTLSVPGRAVWYARTLFSGLPQKIKIRGISPQGGRGRGRHARRLLPPKGHFRPARGKRLALAGEKKGGKRTEVGTEERKEKKGAEGTEVGTEERKEKKAAEETKVGTEERKEKKAAEETEVGTEERKKKAAERRETKKKKRIMKRAEKKKKEENVEEGMPEGSR